MKTVTIKQLFIFLLPVFIEVQVYAQQDTDVLPKTSFPATENNTPRNGNDLLAGELPLKLEAALLTASYTTQAFMHCPEHSFLPVILQQFSVKARSNGVTVSWNTSEEYQLNQYVIEYSANGRVFSEMNIIAASGNHYYELLHANPLTGANYYRVRINSRDGRTAYTETRKVMVQ